MTCFSSGEPRVDKGKSVFDDEDEDQPNKMSKDMIAQKEEEDRIERLKRAQLKRD